MLENPNPTAAQMPALIDPSTMGGGPDPDAAVPAEAPRLPPSLPQGFIDSHEGASCPRQLGRRIMVGYVRNSTDRQEESVPTQKAAIQAYADAVGVDELIFEVDEGLTGFNLEDRPAMNRVLDRFCRREADILCVFRASRAARDPGDLFKIWTTVERAGGELHSLNRKRITEMEVLFEAVFGQAEIKRMKGQLAEGVKNAIRNGKVKAQVAFGYDRHAHLRAVHFKHVERAVIVRQAFELRAKGVSPTVIARKFTEAKIPEPSECRKLDRLEITREQCRCQWKDWMVNGLFEKPLYMGLILYSTTETVRDPRTNRPIGKRKRPRKDWIEGYNEDLAIVPPHLWLMVFAIRRGSASLLPERGNVRPLTHMFTPCQFCGADGAKLQFRSTGAYGSGNIGCSTAYSNPKLCKGCGQHDLATIERLVLQIVGEHVINEETNAVYRSEYAKHHAAVVDAIVRERIRLGSEITKCQALLDKSFDDILMLGFDPAAAAVQRQRLSRRQSEVEAELRALPMAPENVESGLASLDTLEKGFAKLVEQVPYRPTDANGRELVAAMRSLVQKVVIHPPAADGEVRIAVTTSIEALIGAQASRGLTGMLTATHETSYNVTTARKIAAASKKEKREAARNAIATSGRHDLSESAWEDLKPLVADVEHKLTRCSGARNLLDAISYVLREDRRFSDLPAKFGDWRKLKSAFQILIYDGHWDRCKAVLLERHPNHLEGCDLSKFDSTVFRRKRTVDSDFARMNGLQIRALLSDEHPEIVGKRLEAVALKQDGLTYEQVAERTGFSIPTIYSWRRSFSTLGLKALLGPAKGTGRHRLSEADILGLKSFVEEGVNPYRPGKRIDMQAMVRKVRDEHKVRITSVSLSERMREAGFGLRAVAQAQSLKRARDAEAIARALPTREAAQVPDPGRAEGPAPA